MSGQLTIVQRINLATLKYHAILKAYHWRFRVRPPHGNGWSSTPRHESSTPVITLVSSNVSESAAGHRHPGRSPRNAFHASLHSSMPQRTRHKCSSPNRQHSPLSSLFQNFSVIMYRSFVNTTQPATNFLRPIAFSILQNILHKLQTMYNRLTP